MKIVVVRSPRRSAWRSCVSIVDNLEEAYRRAYGDRVEVYSHDSRGSYAANRKRIREVASRGPLRLVLIDHNERPVEFLMTWLAEAGQALQVTPIDQHIYGDFWAPCREWCLIESKLAGIPLRFIAASQASARLAGKLLKSGRDAIDVIPFPVDTRVFAHDPAARKAERERLGISPDAFVLCYSGRFSMQKNITLLIRSLAKVARRSDRPLELVLAGSFDDIGVDFLNIDLARGFYRSQVQDRLLAATRDGRLRCRMLGDLNPAELARVYAMSDLTVSLSLHHDEDYGMAPAESLCSGTPVLLSGWGGFLSFADQLPKALADWAIGIIEARNEGSNVSLALGELERRIGAQIAAPLPEAWRADLAREATASLSIDATASRIARLQGVGRPFIGFSLALRELAYEIIRPGRYSERRFAEPAYRELYSEYLR